MACHSDTSNHAEIYLENEIVKPNNTNEFSPMGAMLLDMAIHTYE